MLFLCYPMLVKIALSALKCIQVGESRYLMADLEEICFTGRHVEYLMMLTIPQIILVVLGLPLLSLGIILRNTHHVHKYSFRLRYGLLYLGYRENREWWELIVVLRKVCIVCISVFGTMMGAVDLQAFLALFVIFFSILLHLIFKPFDTSIKEMLLLHQLECAALTFCWFTFWGGLLFYLGDETPGSVPPQVLIFMSTAIILANVGFLLFAVYEFVKEFVRDILKTGSAKKGRGNTCKKGWCDKKKQQHSLIAVVPVSDTAERVNVRSWRNEGGGGGVQ